jgi:hypothetical protein
MLPSFPPSLVLDLSTRGAHVGSRFTAGRVKPEPEATEKKVSETEFITAAMFKTFLDSHNKQMDTIQHSLDSLNSIYYDEYEDYEDEEGDNSEDELPRKIARSDTDVLLWTNHRPK